VLVVALVHPTYAIVLLAALTGAVLASRRNALVLAIGVLETAGCSD
jgi:hypothetical protein